MYFQSGPEPEYVASVGQLPDGRRVAVFLHDDKINADLFITQDDQRPEIWLKAASGGRGEMEQLLAEFLRVFHLLRATMPPISPAKGENPL